MTILQLDTWRSLFSEDECNFDEVSKYLDFINEAIEKYDPERYSEWHHILPKCIDEEKKFRDQGVRINGRDHFLAHKMLVECFNTTTFRRNLQYAVCRMIPQILRRSSDSLSLDEVELARQRMSELQRGTNSPNYGKKMSDATRRKISVANKGVSRSDTCRERLREVNLGKRLSEEAKIKIGEANRGRTVSEETRLKISKSKQGDLNPAKRQDVRDKMRESHLGKKLSAEHCRKLSESKRRENLSEETLKRRSESMKGKFWINNGTRNALVPPGTEIPFGWSKGMTCK